MLTEHVRQALGMQIVSPYLKDQKLYVLTLDPELEQTFSEGIQQTEQGGSFLALPPDVTQQLLNRLVEAAGKMMNSGYQPAILCSPVVRLHLKRLTERVIPDLAVLSFNEIFPSVQVESLGVVNIDEN